MNHPRVPARRLAAIFVGAVVAALLVSILAGVLVLRRSYATVDGDLRVLGLGAQVEVLRDVDGVPHIYARNAHDLFFAQGYVTAQDRLFQLEFLRRIGQGRLSEIFGGATLDTDRFLRTLGIYRVAESEFALLSPETRAALEAYAQGVNKYAETHADRPPIEFVILGNSWEAWRPADTIVIGKIMAWDLGGNMQSELVRADVVARLGPEASRALFPDPPAETPPILSRDGRTGGRASPGPAASFWRAPGDAVLRIRGAEQLRALLGGGDELPLGLGSNSWVVSGARSASGKPILANDTHLGLRNPSIWYLVHLSGAGYDVAGFSIPGAPGVIIGRNDRIAWGVTNVGPDVQDLYVEQPNPQDLRQFRFGDRFEAAAVRREEIRVKGQREPVVLAVTVTRHGPVLTPVLEGTREIVALRWTALEPGRLLEAVRKLNLASNWEEFRDALRDWDVPSQNFVYADVDGHIGYQMPGRIPIRAKGDGAAPAPGWSGDHEWVGFVPFEELPSRLDPPEGVIVTANQRVVASSAHYLGREWDPGFRAQRIHELLAERERWSAAAFAGLQADVKDVAAERFLSFLRTVPTGDPAAAKAQALLRDWDATMRAESAAAAIYHSWLRHMLRLTFRDKLGDALYRQYLGLGRTAITALYHLVREPSGPWFVVLAEPGRGGRDRLAALALADAAKELEQTLGPEARDWSWGRLHTVTFPHPLGAVTPLDRVFNIGPYPIGGNGLTVANAGYSLRSQSYAQTVHSSQRIVLDLADLDGSLAIYPTGQAGQPLAPHWGDMTGKWLRGELAPLRWSRERLGALEGRLTLRPR